ncbi:MAG: nucleoside-diphosphate sugar epimerase/dehydratase [Syntrophobacteraceae bacterium]
MIFLDVLAFGAALSVAYLIRFEFELDNKYFYQFRAVLPVLIALKLAIFFLFRLYRGMWRYFTVMDYWRLVYATLLATPVSLLVLPLFFTKIPRSIVLLDTVLTIILAGGIRILIRSVYAAQTTSLGLSAFSLPQILAPKTKQKHILIIGAGYSGEKLARKIADNLQGKYRIAGFLDDDPGKLGRTIHGVPVLGPVEKLSRIVQKYAIQEIFISIPSASGSQMRHIMDMCRSCGVPHKTLPAIGQIMEGEVSVNALRDINYEDLLRRPPVHLDATGIRDYVTGGTVLVTGAGGSIGSELCRQLIRYNPERLILVDAGEANLYGIQMELRYEFKFDAYHTILARVQNVGIMREVFKTYKPDVVFHAAAYKHVPMLERNPWEAVFNNVMGTQVVMDMAEEYGAKRFVLVSTDKAVRPTNVMGTTKRLAELLFQSRCGNNTPFMAVRFGNVLASSGSVIPLFRKQIENGGPVTVTHPEVTRYFMTIHEAAQLILQAGALGLGGEIFVLEMGTPVKIADLAEDLIRLSGKEPGRDIGVIFTGLRPGEKLYEELITRSEDVTHTKHEKIMVLRNGNKDWGGRGDQAQFRGWLVQKIEELYHTAETHNACAIKEKLRELIPEYMPQDTECALTPQKKEAVKPESP